MTAAELDPEQIFAEHFPPLLELALSNRIPAKEAEELAHAVLLSSILHLSRIGDITAWLQGALRCAIARRTTGA